MSTIKNIESTQLPEKSKSKNIESNTKKEMLPRKILKHKYIII